MQTIYVVPCIAVYLHHYPKHSGYILRVQVRSPASHTPVRMVNFRDPDVVVSNIRTYILLGLSWSFVNTFQRDCFQVLARCRRPIPVSLPRIGISPHQSFTYAKPSASSWEFFTTLDYEWNIFRGHRPYQRSIWVCNDISFSRISSLTCSAGLSLPSPTVMA